MFTLIESSFFQDQSQMMPRWLVNLIQADSSIEGNSQTEASILAVDLSPLSLINVEGDEAEAFLQGQFSNDLTLLSKNQCQLNSYCNPKGRALCVIRIMRHDQGFWLLIPENLSDAIIKRLTLYKMRAKVTIEKDTSRIAFGLISRVGLNLLDQSDGACVYRVNGELGAIPQYLRADSKIERAIAIAPKDSLSSDGKVLDHSVWRLSDILCGIPQVYAETMESFIPQTVNLDLVEAINFSKGCYPGQEIVARLRYLGKLKQRMAIALIDIEGSGDQDMVSGTALHRSDKPDQKVGMVVDGIKITENTVVVTAMVPADYVKNKMRIAESEDESTQAFDLITPSGKIVRVQSLPYDIPANKDRQSVN